MTVAHKLSQTHFDLNQRIAQWKEITKKPTKIKQRQTIDWFNASEPVSVTLNNDSCLIQLIPPSTGNFKTKSKYWFPMKSWSGRGDTINNPQLPGSNAQASLCPLINLVEGGACKTNACLENKCFAWSKDACKLMHIWKTNVLQKKRSAEEIILTSLFIFTLAEIVWNRSQKR